MVSVSQEYLRRFPPLADVSDDALAEVERAGEIRTYEPGTVILQEDGTPATHLSIVRTGSVELVHDDDIIDVLEPGEAFGHPSLLTGLAPAFDVRAREETTCLVLPADHASELLAGPAGVRFVARSLRDRMVRTGYVAHAGGDVRNAKLGSLVHRPAAFCTPETTVADAARTMAEADVSCVLVRLGDHFGLLTDSDIRARLVARGRGLDTPVSEVMTTPALTFAADRLAIDAMIDMLDLGIHHLPVLGADGVPMGVVTATDLLYLEGRTPFGLRRSIAHAPTREAVVEATSHLPATVVALIRAGVPATDVGRVVALAGDTTTMRLIDLAFEELGPAEWEWAWMALGSTARREASLASDQDNAFAYADGADDDYFQRLTAYVNSGLSDCGFGEDNAEVVARNPVWRKSRSGWQEVFEACLEQPDRSHLVRAVVAFDFRHVWGGLEIVKPLVAIERTAHRHPDFVQRLARTATDIKVPLGFRGRVTTDGDGRIDLKLGAIVPICNLARFHAIAAGVTISSTLARLDAAEAAGAVDGDTAAMLREAFEFCTRIRLEHQVRQVSDGIPPDNHLMPDELPPLARAQLKAALRAIQDAQKQLARFVPLGL